MMEFLKDIAGIFVSALIAFVGYFLINASSAIDLLDKNGNILWGSVLLCLTLFIVGYVIFYFGEKLWEGKNQNS